VPFKWVVSIHSRAPRIIQGVDYVFLSS